MTDLNFMDTLNSILTVIGPILIGVGLIMTSIQIKHFVKAHHENHEWNRRIETQKAIKGVAQDIVPNLLNREFRYIKRKQPIPIEELLKAFDKNPDLHPQCHILLNSYEALARGVYQGIFSEQIIRNARKGAMRRTFIAFQDYINYRRNGGSPSAWTEYERLLKKWSNDSEETHAPLGKL